MRVLSSNIFHLIRNDYMCVLETSENFKSVMLRSFEIPFENVQAGLNNDRERKTCKNCCLRAPRPEEEVSVVQKHSRLRKSIGSWY